MTNAIIAIIAGAETRTCRRRPEIEPTMLRSTPEVLHRFRLRIIDTLVNEKTARRVSSGHMGKLLKVRILRKANNSLI